MDNKILDKVVELHRQIGSLYFCYNMAAQSNNIAEQERIDKELSKLKMKAKIYEESIYQL